MTAFAPAAKERLAARPLKTAIVGGLQGFNVLLPAFQAVPDFEVVAFCARNLEKLRPLATRLGAGKLCSGWESLSGDADIDVVALALPAAVQAEAAVQLAKAGKILFCEKPLATTCVDAERIVSAVRDSGRKAVVHFGFRFVPAFESFTEIIRSGELGRPELVKVEWLLATRRDPTFSWNWKSDATMGGGTFFLMTSHVLDYLGSWFGGIRGLDLLPTTIVTSRPDALTNLPKPVLAEDTCNILLALGCGAPASVSISAALSVGGNHRIRVWFEKGLIEIANGPDDDTYDGFQLSFHPGRLTRPLPPLTAQLAAKTQATRAPTTRILIAQRSVEALATSIRTGESGDCSLEAALEVQRWLEKGRRDSARWQQPA